MPELPAEPDAQTSYAARPLPDQARTASRGSASRTPSHPVAGRTRVSGSPISTNYQYVVSDLKRIAVLAAGAFAILGALAVAIR